VRMSQELAEVIAGVGAVIFGALFTGLGFLIKRAIDARDDRRASRQVYELLWQIFAELEEIGSGDFNSPPGFWYRRELAQILMTLTERHHRALGGAGVYRLVRLVGGLNAFTIDPKKPDGGVYSMDERIKDAGTVMFALLPKAFPDVKSQKREEARLRKQRLLMTMGVLPPEAQASEAGSALKGPLT